MLCSICKFPFERQYCRVCGNDSKSPCDLSIPGVPELIEAHAAKNHPREDYAASVAAFGRAVRHASSFPPVLAMVTWFEYAMAICTHNDGGPPRKLFPAALQQFVQTLERSQAIYESLPEESKKALSGENYPNLFGSNLNEAKRVREQRGGSNRPGG